MAYPAIKPVIKGNRRPAIRFGRYIVSDRFNRDDSALTLGNAETGQAWNPFAGTWGIISSQAYLVSVTALASAAIESGMADVIVKDDITLSATANRATAGIIMRAQDNNNYLLLEMVKTGATGTNDRMQLFKRDAGSYTQLADLQSAGLVNGQTYAVRCELIGDSVKILRDGVQKLSYTLTRAELIKYGVYTKYGPYVSASAGTDDGGSRHNNFVVEPA